MYGSAILGIWTILVVSDLGARTYTTSIEGVLPTDAAWSVSTGALVAWLTILFLTSARRYLLAEREAERRFGEWGRSYRSPDGGGRHQRRPARRLTVGVERVAIGEPSPESTSPPSLWRWRSFTSSPTPSSPTEPSLPPSPVRPGRRATEAAGEVLRGIRPYRAPGSRGNVRDLGEPQGSTIALRYARAQAFAAVMLLTLAVVFLLDGAALASALAVEGALLAYLVRPSVGGETAPRLSGRRLITAKSWLLLTFAALYSLGTVVWRAIDPFGVTDGEDAPTCPS